MLVQSLWNECLSSIAAACEACWHLRHIKDDHVQSVITAQRQTSILSEEFDSLRRQQSPHFTKPPTTIPEWKLLKHQYWGRIWVCIVGESALRADRWRREELLKTCHTNSEWTHRKKVHLSDIKHTSNVGKVEEFTPERSEACLTFWKLINNTDQISVRFYAQSFMRIPLLAALWVWLSLHNVWHYNNITLEGN